MGEENKSNGFEGKKIFFLYPNPLIRNTIIKEIIKFEYEIYVLDEHTKVFGLLKKFPDSIIFVNVDDVLDKDKWSKFIQKILKSPETKDVMLGVMSSFVDKSMVIGDVRLLEKVKEDV